MHLENNFIMIIEKTVVLTTASNKTALFVSYTNSGKIKASETHTTNPKSLNMYTWFSYHKKTST